MSAALRIRRKVIQVLAFPEGARGDDVQDVAVIGMSCRFPGAADVAAFWGLLRDGRDAVPVGAGVGGAILEDVDRFDAEFFGLSPRESAAMDPQQRLMLELVWEALEQGCLVPGSLAGSSTGLFVGCTSADYSALLVEAGAAAIDRYALTGRSAALVSQRVSHFLRLHGPSITVDTGQSSALSAVHLACQSLRAGECLQAVAGGVQLNLSTAGSLRLAEFGALSPDGRCYTFDARANGFVRGEGGGVVVLKPLAAALRDGDRVQAVICGSATNSGTGDDLVVPSASAQEAVIRSALRAARVEPDRIRYVELHGTATKVGDPVEAAALGAAIGAQRDQDPLLVGSVKTNIGHLEGAAGIAGLLKVVLSLWHGQLPPSLNYVRANPAIPMEHHRLEVVRELTPLSEERTYAGVSSFGVGGANCHVVLRSAAPDERPRARTATAAVGPAGADDQVLPWVLSARTPDALREQASRLRDAVSGRRPVDVAWSLATGRTVFGERAVVLGRDLDAVAGELAALRSGVPGQATVTGTGRPGRVAFVFPGQGSQWPGMARELWDTSAVFRASLQRCDEALRPHVGWSLEKVVLDPEQRFEAAGVVQPALFGVMVSLAQVWRSWGVHPDAVVGHSQGEIAAACVAGALSLEEAARLVVRRARLLERLAPAGGLWSVELSEDDVFSRLGSGRWPGVSVAAVNGPRQVVVGGDPDILIRLGAAWAGEGIRVRQIPVDYASHTSHMAGLRSELLQHLGTVATHPAAVPFYSALDAEPRAGAVLDAGYWVANLCRPVRFGDVSKRLLADGFRFFVELSPHPALLGGIQETIVSTGSVGAVAVGSLRRDDGGPARLLRSAAEAFVAGVPVDWAAALTGVAAPGVPVELPGYAFQRESHWLPATPPRADDAAVSVPTDGSAATVGSVLTAVSTSARTTGRTDPDQGRPLSALDRVRAELAVVLGYAGPTSVPAGRTFKDLGLSSLGAVELAGRLSATCGRPVAPSLIFDHPTADLLAHALFGAVDVVASAAVTPVLPRPSGGPLDDPCVVVGMACRFPGGVASPQDLWDLVLRREDAIGPPPPDRGWPQRRLGGFLADADQFDAELFGISPREALAMDPQQRVLLEVVWQALEDARIVPTALRGTLSGVFVGAMAGDYGPALQDTTGELLGFRLTGSTASVLSGRIAYTLGLQGPALTIDTACSSSLVSLHQAARALQAGDCDLALVGGVTIMATPGMFHEFGRQEALAPDGRCRAFAAEAAGTTWSEGAAAVVVEKLSDAVRRGHRVLAVVRGTAVNQDGTSNGLTAPSGPAQQRVIRAALAEAGLEAQDIDVVEAHGTGTPLGDPIEAAAVLATYGVRPAGSNPVWLGSLKSNVGHTQAAAGLGGLIKMVMALRARTLPSTLHVDRASPHVDWSAGQVRLLTQEQDWPGLGRPRRAAVSSFGISGTNAHVIVEEAAQSESPEPGADPGHGPGVDLVVVPLVVAARGEAALRAQAGRLADRLAAGAADDGSGTLQDVGYALATTRAHLEHRLVVLGADAAELCGTLRGVAAGEQPPGAVTGVARAAGRAAFVFPGQGGQWAGMGAGLLATDPVFARHLRACEQAFSSWVDWSPVDVLEQRPGAPGLDRVDVVQPVQFAVATGLAAVWRSAGVEPAAVAGHSQGEIAAAFVAGALSLADAVRVVVLRSRALAGIANTGGMLWAGVTPEQAEQALAPWAGRVSLAAVNGPSSVVLSGAAAALDELATGFGPDRSRRLVVDYAAHSADVDVLREEFVAALAGLAPRRGDLAFYSGVTGERLDTATLDPEYWFSNLRQPVLLEPAIRAMYRDGHSVFVESGPHPVLGAAITDTLHAGGADPDDVVVVGSLRRGEDDARRLLTSLAQAHVRGVDIDWAARFAGTRAKVVDLPSYAFQRQSYWLDGQAAERVPALDTGTRPPDAEPGLDHGESASTWADQLRALSAAARRRTMTEFVRTHVAAVQGHGSSGAVDARRGLREQGLTSVAAADLRNRLAAGTGLRLPVSVVFDHPTPEALGDHLGVLLLHPEQDRTDGPDHLDHPDPVVGDDLADATDQELIDYIGKELGIT